MLAPFAAYARARFADDPHLWASALFDEVVPLGYAGAYPTYRAERYEDHVAALFDGAVLDESDIRRVLGAMRAQMPQTVPPDPSELARTRDRLQCDLNDGRMTTEMFSREWRRLERPATPLEVRPDDLRLARARRALAPHGADVTR